MKYWQKKIKCCIAILASLFMIEQGIDGNEENHLVFGYQAEENKGISYEKETEKIQMKQEYIEVEWGKVYQLEENGTEILFEEQAGNIVIYETRETEKRKIKEEKMNSPLWLYDIDQDGCLEVLTNKKEIEGTFYDWDEENHQFRKAYQKCLSEREREQELVFINKNTEEQVSGIEGATYYELSVYDKKEQGGLLQNIRYPFVEDEWSVFNNFSFLDVNFDEYTDLSITFQREYIYGSPLDFLFYWNPEKRQFENTFGGNLLENPYENAVYLYEMNPEKEWMLMHDPLGTGCREELLYKFIEGQWKLCRQFYIEDLVIYPVHIQIKDTVQDEIILESDVPTEEFYEKEQEFYDIFYQGM